MKNDLLIIGGGVIGCSIALKLAEAGVGVTLIERGRIGCEASSAAAGMLSPQADALRPDDFFRLAIHSRSLYKDFVAHLYEASGIDAQLRDEGTLFVSIAGVEDRAADWAGWQKAAGLRLEKLSADEVFKMEPAVSRRSSGGFFMPDDHQVENRLLMQALALAVRRAGVEVLEGEAVTGLLVENHRVKGVACGDRQIQAGGVVVAAGSWSGNLLERA